MPQQVYKKTYVCPFKCGKSYTREHQLKNHLITRKAVNDEYHSDAKTEEWKQAEDAGLLSMATRSCVLTDVERKARRNKSSRDWQLAHKDKVAANRRDHMRDIQKGIKVANRAAKIAILARSENSTSYQRNRQTVLQKAFRNKDLRPFAKLIDPSLPATVATFPALVATFLTSDQWPTVISVRQSIDSNDKSGLILNQIPGDHHYQALSRQLRHEDTDPGMLAHRLRSRGPAQNGDSDRYGRLGEGPSDTVDRVVRPSAEMGKLLDAAYGLWRDVLNSHRLRDEMYVPLMVDDTEFALRSPDHATILEFYRTWSGLVISSLHALTINSFSLAQIDNFVNNNELVETAVHPLLEGHETDPEDEDGVNRMDVIQVLESTLNFVGKRKPGRPAMVRDEDEEEDEDSGI